MKDSLMKNGEFPTGLLLAFYGMGARVSGDTHHDLHDIAQLHDYLGIFVLSFSKRRHLGLDWIVPFTALVYLPCGAKGFSGRHRLCSYSTNAEDKERRISSCSRFIHLIDFSMAASIIPEPPPGLSCIRTYLPLPP